MANILFINTFIDPSIGGVEKVMCTLASCFKNKGHHVYCAVNRKSLIPENLPYEKVLANWEELIIFIQRYNITTVINQAPHLRFFIKIVEKISSVYPHLHIISCLHNDPDFLFDNLKESFLIHNCKNFKLVISTFIRWGLFPVYYYYKKRKIKQIYKRGYDVSNIFVLLSQRFEKRFLEIAGIFENSKMKYIPNPIAPFLLDCSLPDLLEFKKNVVVIVARLTTIKRIDLAIKIWAELNRQYKSAQNWTLKIIGGGPELQKLKKITKQFELQNVLFKGPLINPMSEYKEAKLFMMTSLYEGFGLTLVESQMNAVVPIVFDSYAALHDIIEDGFNGFIIENNNIQEYLTRLMNVMENEGQRERMASNGFISSQGYTPEHIFCYWENIIQ